jgi:drug/metabolite transporter (DMT)-like permease
VESEAVLEKSLPLESTRGVRTRAIALPWQVAALGAILLASTGHLLIKFGLVAAARSALPTSAMGHISHTLLQPTLVLGLGIYGIGTLLWISAVSRRDISFLYPLTALNYVIVSVGGLLWFGEQISTGRWIGISIVVLGVGLLQFSSGEDQ